MFFKFLKILLPWYKKLIFQIFFIWLCITTYILINIITSDTRIYIKNEVNSVLGWDIKITWTVDLSKNQANKLFELSSKYNFEISKKIEFYTSLRLKNWDFKMVQIIWADDNFPFYAKINYKTINPKSLKNVYSDSYTFYNLSQNNKIKLLNKDLELKWIIKDFPQSLISFYNEKRFVLVPLKEIDWLDFDQSRVNYSYLIKLNSENYKKVYEQIKLIPEIKSNFQIVDYTELSNHLQFFINDFEKYANIVIIIFFVISWILIFININTFFINNFEKISILKLLWLKPWIITYYLFILFFIILFVSYFTSIILIFLLSNIKWIFYSYHIFPLFKTIFLKGFVIWFLLIFAPVSLTIYKFSTKNAILGIKDDFLNTFTTKEKTLQILTFVIVLFLVYSISLWNFQYWIIFSLLFVIFSIFIFLMLNFLFKFIFNKIIKRIRNSNFCLFDSFRSNILPWNTSKLIIIWFIISLVGFLVVWEVSFAFIDKLLIWMKNQPNIYVINILKEDLPKIKDYNDWDNTFSAIFAQIITINWEYLSDYFAPEKIPVDFLQESYITDSYLNDMIFAGKKDVWFNEISIDKSYTTKLKVGIGDTIWFLLAWREFNLKIANIRQTQIKWSNPFFNFQVNSEQFKNAPKSYFYVKNIPPEKIDDFKKDIYTTLGTHISIIQADKILTLMYDMSLKLIFLCLLILTLIVFLSFLILKSSIWLWEKMKKTKINLYHILWAHKNFLEKNTFFEYFFIIIISYLIGIILWLLILNYITYVSDLFVLNSVFIKNIIILLIIFFIIQIPIFYFLRKFSKNIYYNNKTNNV